MLSVVVCFRKEHLQRFIHLLAVSSIFKIKYKGFNISYKMHAANLKACTITFWNLVPLSQKAPLKTVPVDASKLDNCHQMDIYSELFQKVGSISWQQIKIPTSSKKSSFAAV